MQDEPLIRSNSATVQRFVVSSPCFQRLVFRLEQRVDELRDENEARIAQSQREKSGWRNGFWRLFSYIARMLEPEPRVGTIRIRWSCSCGAMMWDDFSQRSSVDARILETRLNRLFRTVPNGYTAAQNSNTAFSPLRSPQMLGNSFRTLVGILTRRNARQRDPENTTPPPAQQTQPDTDIYLLTCVDAGQGLPRLFQGKWNSIHNDKAYFQMLRTLYEASRAGWRRWLTFRTVTAIEYVRVCDLGFIAWLLHFADSASSTRP